MNPRVNSSGTTRLAPAKHAARIPQRNPTAKIAARRQPQRQKKRRSVKKHAHTDFKQQFHFYALSFRIFSILTSLVLRHRTWIAWRTSSSETEAGATTMFRSSGSRP